MPARLTTIYRYPVKSCRGESIETAVVEPWGLAGDRRWMVIDEDDVAITARTVHHLLLLRPEITAGGLRIQAPGLPELHVARPDPGDQVPVRIWASSLTAAAAGPEADAWFTAAIGRPARLVYLDDPARRAIDPRFSDDGDRVSFADGYPLLVTSEDSLAALNVTVLGSARQSREPLPMRRFRPSVVVSGLEPWVEDDWRRIRIGEATFRAVKGCARCVMTTVDPDSGERGKEPIASLARIRRWDSATWFGVNLIPELTPGGPAPVVSVGDDLEVLESVPPGGGPIRPSQLL